MRRADEAEIRAPDAPRPAWLTAPGFVAAATLAGLVLVGHGLHALLAAYVPLPPVDADAARRILVSIPGAIRPERDSLVYLGLIGAAAALVAGAALLARRLRLPAATAWSDVVVLVLIGLAAAAGWSASRPEFATATGLGGLSPGIVAILLAVSLLGAWLASVRRPRGRHAGWPVYLQCGLAAAFVLSWQVVGVDALQDPYGHWDTVFYSVVQIAQGDVCLHDLSPQYGCYGEILRPLFLSVGLSVASGTAVFAALNGVAMAAVVVFGNRLLRSPLLASAASFCVLVALSRVLYLFDDPYFQYAPIRFLFPALSLIGVLSWARRAGTAKAVGLGLFAGLGLFWNLDSGVVVCVALALFVLLARSGRRDFSGRLFHAACFGLAVLGCVALALLYLSWRAGAVVDPAALIAYHRLFVGLGFFMLPMPGLPAYWMPAIAVYAVAIAVWASKAHDGRAGRRAELAAYLALLGTGLFSYYVGRSHFLVFVLAAWPAFIVAAHLLETAARPLARVSPRLARSVVAFAALFVLGLCALVAADKLPGLASALAGRSPVAAAGSRGPVAAAGSRGPVAAAGSRGPVAEDARFIREQAPAGEAVAVFAPHQASLLAEAGRRSFASPGIAETLLRADAGRTVARLLESGPTHLFVARRLLEDDVQLVVFEPWVRAAYPRILREYAVAGTGPDGRLLHLVRRERPDAGGP